MFTGIIERIGKVVSIEKESDNANIVVAADFADSLILGQSIAHSGVCLTVTKIFSDSYEVTAVKETLKKTNFQYLKVGDVLNLERSMQMSTRLDGHLVQGHVDDIVTCEEMTEQNGSWFFTFSYQKLHSNLLVSKGSIALNGISLTLAEVKDATFSVAIIPHTFYHTQMQYMKTQDKANVEFDIIGKYVQRSLQLFNQK